MIIHVRRFLPSDGYALEGYLPYIGYVLERFLLFYGYVLENNRIFALKNTNLQNHV